MISGPNHRGSKGHISELQKRVYKARGRVELTRLKKLQKSMLRKSELFYWYSTDATFKVLKASLKIGDDAKKPYTDKTKK